MSKDKFQNKYRIPSARAMWHDYNGGEYFITICTANREHYFGAIRDGEMILNVLGQKLNELTTEIPNHNPHAEIPVYQIMPNHVHCKPSAKYIFCAQKIAITFTKKTEVYVNKKKNEKRVLFYSPFMAKKWHESH